MSPLKDIIYFYILFICLSVCPTVYWSVSFLVGQGVRLSISWLISQSVEKGNIEGEYIEHTNL